MTSDANQQQAEFWDQTAPNWIEAEQHSRIVSDAFGDAAMERLDARAGERVVDLGCGTGDSTAMLTALVAPNGTALGVDISSGMIAEARRRHGRVANIDFAVADPQVDGLGGQRFDAGYSKFGVMFFADPAAAFANIRSLLAPSGRLAFACWRDVFSNEWMLLAGMAVTSVTGSLPPMPGPGEPGPMSLADPDVISALLTGAGFTDVDITPLERIIDQPESDVESFVAMSRRIGPVGGALRESPDEQFDNRLLAAVREALQEKVTDGRLRLTAAANIVSARA